jgi:hypothetical protein
VLITNGEFVAFHGPDPTMIRVGEKHAGTVRFSNCAFWGPCNRNAVVDGYGTVGFSDCSFMQWGHKVGKTDGSKPDVPSLDILGGSVLIRGCEFMDDKPQVHLGTRVERAIVTDNLIAGKQRIIKDLRGKAVVKHNLTTPNTNEWRMRMKETPGYRASRFKHDPKKEKSGEKK